MSVKKCIKCGKMKDMPIKEDICTDCKGERKIRSYKEYLEEAIKKDKKNYSQFKHIINRQ